MSVRLKQWSTRVLILGFVVLIGTYVLVTSNRSQYLDPQTSSIYAQEVDEFEGYSNVPRIEILDSDPANGRGQKKEQDLGACKIPHLDVNGTDVNKFFKKIPPLDCKKRKEENWLRLDADGSVQLTEYAKTNFDEKSINCSLHFYYRVNDARLKWSVARNFQIGSKVDKGDYFLAKCDSKPDKKWEGLFMTIVPKKERMEEQRKAERPLDWSGLNVHFLGFDSLSQMSFRRNLPKSVAYLEKTMGSIVLNGYNIVGDGTPQAFIPILTGQTEEELPLTRRRYAEANYVDVYPFVWNNMSKAGYMTLYGEDAAGIGTFTYRLKGFKDQPTDHYTRTFFQFSEKHEHDWKCIGPEPQHWQWFRYAEEFVQRYPQDIAKFLVMHHSILSHDDINLAQVLDDDLSAHLQKMFESGAFDNSLVVVMADHGHRFSQLRDTQQGQLEERLPFFSVYLPLAFRESERGSIAFANLIKNANRLTSPFDIYSTLLDIIHWPTNEELSKPHDPASSRSLSLFREIPETRSCEQAGIAPHWCTCLSWHSAMNGDLLNTSKILAKAVVQAINGKTRPERQLCAPLRMKELIDAKRLVPHDSLLKYAGVLDNDGFVPHLNGNATTTFATYQLKFVTQPGDAKYEATVQFDSRANVVTVDMTAISHINAYGDAPHCIIDKNYFLAAYCVCYDKIKA